MKYFFSRLAFFLIPILLFFLVPLYVLSSSKESLYVIDETLIGKEKYLIGYAYNEVNYSYLKWKYIKLNDRKNLWALGSSRVLQFREQMFDCSFYNAGYSIYKINDFIPFLKSIPHTKYPEYIILGLDQWMFNSNWDNLNSYPSENYWAESFTFYPKMATYRSVYNDLFSGKYDLINWSNRTTLHKIGLNAVVNNKGFRNDGSMYYGDQIEKLIAHDTSANDYNYSGTLERIEKGNNRFEFGDTVNQKAIVELDRLLQYCKIYKINVVAILPPYAPEIYTNMMKTGKYNYIKDIYFKLKPIFDKYNYEVYDFSQGFLSSTGQNEALDGFHGGELTYLKILSSILDSGSIINKVANKSKLKNDFADRKNSYVIYNY